MTPLTVDPIGVDLLHEQIARNTLARSNVFYALPPPDHIPPVLDNEEVRQLANKNDWCDSCLREREEWEDENDNSK